MQRLLVLRLNEAIKEHKDVLYKIPRLAAASTEYEYAEKKIVQDHFSQHLIVGSSQNKAGKQLTGGRSTSRRCEPRHVCIEKVF